MAASAEFKAMLSERYRLERELGTGGAGVVYLARDLKHDRDVAIKVVRPELTDSAFSRERFEREVKISALLQHPHILPLHDSGVAAGRVYCVMPFIKGESLRDLMLRDKQLSIEKALQLASEVASALNYAHEQGIVHRDIKPENVLISNGHAIVADFGIARALGMEGSDRLTQTGLAMGSPRYMSPEQATGEANVDGRSDIYSLGCMTYEMLTGEPPFQGANAQAIIARHLQQEPPSARLVRKAVPVPMDDAIRQAMAKDPVDRFPTAAAFAEALTGAIPSTLRLRETRLAWKRGATMLAAGAAVAAAGWFGWTGLSGARDLDRDVVAVAPFDVSDPALATWREGLVDLLARNLNGAGPLRAVPPSLSTPGWNGRADEASALALGRRTSAGTSVVGAVDRVGTDSLRLTVTAFDVEGGRLIGDYALTLPTVRMDAAADSLTVGILSTLGRERPLGSARPPSSGPNAMVALKAYLLGEMYLHAAKWDSAQFAYARAAQLDSAYALAYHRLSFLGPLRGSGIDSLIWFHGLRAGRMARGLPERDSLAVTIDSLQAALWFTTLNPSRVGVNRDSIHALLRPRLSSLVEVATRRYPDDAELWFTKSQNVTNWGSRQRSRHDEILGALNQAIRIDSGFAPPYRRAIELTASLRGIDSARALIGAYVRHAPPGPDAGVAGLIDALVDPSRRRSRETVRLLSAAKPTMLFNAWGVLFQHHDTAQTALQLVNQIAAHPEGTLLNPSGAGYVQFLAALTLASRGRAREACERLPARDSNAWLYAQVIHLGCAPDDSTSAAILYRMERARWRPNGINMYLAWWGKVGDTTRLADLRRRGDSVAAIRGAAPSLVASGRFVSESAKAYLALAKGDSAAARRFFNNAPDTLCQLCDVQRLTKVRLLMAAGESRQAFDLASEGADGNGHPFAVLLRLERARLAERLGDRARAIDDYRRVVAAWSVGDPALRDTAKLAQAALTRLSAR